MKRCATSARWCDRLPGPTAARALLTYAINWAVEFAIVAVLVFFWVRPFWRDLHRLHAGRRGRRRRPLRDSARVGRFSPLRQFAEAFRAMAGRIAALLQSHRTLTSAVSHELRTPLARLRFSHSLALEETTARARIATSRAWSATSRKSTSLTTELLDYAKLERGAPAIRLQERSRRARGWRTCSPTRRNGRGTPATPSRSVPRPRSIRCAASRATWRAPW
jgi:signal transduction histidine kinase